MVLLLGSRGQYRGRSGSGFGGALRRVGEMALQLTGFGGRGNQRRSGTRASRGSSTASWIALAGALACFGVGYLVGHSTAGTVAPGGGTGAAGLKADGSNGAAAPQQTASPQQPTMMGDTDVRPLASQAFVVAAYELEAAEAKVRAKALATWLRAQNPALKARPFEFPGQKGPVWIVAVYYDGDVEQAKTRDQLKLLPEDVPDDVFVGLRKRTDWPVAVAIPVR